MSYSVRVDDCSVYYNYGDGDGYFYKGYSSLEEAEAKCNYLNGGDGLTKRERFAMAAMKGLSASDFISDQHASGTYCEQIADIATEQADALIKALKQS